MITSQLISIASYIVQFIIGLLPTYSLPSAAQSALITVVSSLNALNYIIPVQDLINVLLTVLTFEAALLLFRAMMWLWHKVPVIGR